MSTIDDIKAAMAGLKNCKDRETLELMELGISANAEDWLTVLVEFYDAYKDRYRQGQNNDEWYSSEKRFTNARKKLES